MPTPQVPRLVAIVITVPLLACSSWAPFAVGPQGFPSDERPTSMRVTSTGGAVVTVQGPSLINDSITGSTEFGPVRMDRRDLRLLEVRRVSVLKSVGFATINAAVIAGFVALFIHVQPHYYF